MAVRILIPDGSLDRQRYRPADHWRRFLGDVPSESVHLPTGEELPSLQPFTHLIVTGSEASAVDREPWFDTEIRAIREAADRGLRILGSCFGHQMLVRALSGSEYVRHAAGPEIGWLPIEILRDDPILAGFPNPWYAFHLHFDEVTEPPPPWRVLAKTEACGVHAIRFGDRPIWGIQSHPEIGPEEGRAILERMAGLTDAGGVVLERARAQRPRDDGLVQRIVDRFLAF